MEDGGKPFFHLVRKANVDADWVWDQTIRVIITSLLYKTLNTLGEEKAVWQKVTTSSYSLFLFRVY